MLKELNKVVINALFPDVDVKFTMMKDNKEINFNFDQNLIQELLFSSNLKVIQLGLIDSL